MPTVKQDQAWEKLRDDLTKYVVFGGGAGGGKSWMGCEWLVTNCYLYPKSKWFIGREELKRLMSSTYVTFLKVCSHHQIPRSDWKLNGQYNYIEFKNGSRIDLLDVKYLPTDPLYERFGSTEYTGGWLEEAGEIDYLAFDVLKSRVGRQLNKEYNLTPKIFITCNPKKNWLYNEVYKPNKEGTLSREFAFIQSLFGDNVHTAESYKAQLEDIKDPATKQRLMYGNWEYDDDPTVMMSYQAIIDLWKNKVEENGIKYLSCDVARFGKDKTVIYYWEGLRLMKKWEFSKQATDETAQKIRDIAFQESVPYHRIIIDEDGIGGGVVDQLRGVRGFMGNSAPCLNQTTKVPDNFQNIRTQCYYKLADLVNHHQIQIDIQDVQFKAFLIQELEQIKTRDIDNDSKRKMVSKDDIKENIGRSPDYADAIMMRIYFELNQVANKEVQAQTYKPTIRR